MDFVQGFRDRGRLVESMNFNINQKNTFGRNAVITNSEAFEKPKKKFSMDNVFIALVVTVIGGILVLFIWHLLFPNNENKSNPMNDISQSSIFGSNNLNIGHLGVEGYPGDSLKEQLKNYLNEIDPKIVSFLSQGVTVPVWLNQLHANEVLRIKEKLASENIVIIKPTGNSQMSGTGTTVQYNFQPLSDFN